MSYFCKVYELVENQCKCSNPDFDFDDSTRKQIELDKVYKENSQLEEEEMRYGNLEKNFESLKDNMENIISEKIKQYSSKFVKELERMMDESTKKVQVRMGKGDIELFKKMSENDSEFEKITSTYNEF